MKAFNLSSDTTMDFSKDTSPEYAVAYGYYAEIKLSSWFLTKIIEEDDCWKENLIYGNRTVSMGNWCAFI